MSKNLIESSNSKIAVRLSGKIFIDFIFESVFVEREWIILFSEGSIIFIWFGFRHDNNINDWLLVIANVFPFSITYITSPCILSILKLKIFLSYYEIFSIIYS